MSDIEGGCACGAVRFRISGDLMGSGACHCRACQYAAGGAPTYVVLAPVGGFQVTKAVADEPEIGQRHVVMSGDGFQHPGFRLAAIAARV